MQQRPTGPLGPSHWPNLIVHHLAPPCHCPRKKGGDSAKPTQGPFAANHAQPKCGKNWGRDSTKFFGGKQPKSRRRPNTQPGRLAKLLPDGFYCT